MQISNQLRKIAILVGLLTMTLLMITSSLAASGRNSGKQIIGYFTSWGIYGRNYTAKNVADSGAAEKLTVINYAFANVVPEGEDGQVICKIGDPWADYQKTWTEEQSVDGQAVLWGEPLRGNFQQLRALKADHPNIKILISLGGWTWSGHFSDAALTPESRAAFVESCVDLFIHGNLPAEADAGGIGSGVGVFDGIDVDWEYPNAPAAPGNIYRPEDTENFTALLAEFRAQLDAVDPDLLLTIAAPAGEPRYSQMELDKIHESLDWINVMAYDFNGGWDLSTNFQSDLFPARGDSAPQPLTVNDTMSAYLDAGVPAQKLVVGVPFYGRGWTGVTDENNGLYQPATAPAPGTWEAGAEDYKVLADLQNAGFTRYWDNQAKVAWLYDGQTFWTFDDAQTMCHKTAYVQIKDFAGVMFWELSGDDSDGTLISALHDGLSTNHNNRWGFRNCR